MKIDLLKEVKLAFNIMHRFFYKQLYWQRRTKIGEKIKGNNFWMKEKKCEKKGIVSVLMRMYEWL